MNIKFSIYLCLFLKFDVWKHARDLNDSVDVLLSPNDFFSYQKRFKAHDIESKVINDDIQK